MAQVKNNPILLDNTTKLFGVRDNVPGEVVPGFLGVHNLLHVQDRKAAGVNGGDSASGAWRTRDLNTVTVNNISGASLANNRITLPSGIYWIEGSAPAFYCDTHQARLFNVTALTTLLPGSPEVLTVSGTAVAAAATNRSFFSGDITLSELSEIEVQHSFVTSQGSGLGVQASFGIPAIFTDLKIWKLA